MTSMNTANATAPASLIHHSNSTRLPTGGNVDDSRAQRTIAGCVPREAPLRQGWPLPRLQLAFQPAECTDIPTAAFLLHDVFGCSAESDEHASPLTTTSGSASSVDGSRTSPTTTTWLSVDSPVMDTVDRASISCCSSSKSCEKRSSLRSPHDKKLTVQSGPRHSAKQVKNVGRVSHEVKWFTRYRELLEFRALHGNCLVPLDGASHRELSHWVKRQRCLYKEKRAGKGRALTDQREQLLNQIGFVWNVHDKKWDTRIRQLRRFVTEHGHGYVPTQYDDTGLAVWAKSQRQQYRDCLQGQHSNMTRERIDQLNAAGFAWTNEGIADVSSNSSGSNTNTNTNDWVGGNGDVAEDISVSMSVSTAEYFG